MSRTKTIVISVMLIIALASAGAGIWWWKNGDELLASFRNQGKAILEEGQRIGRNSSPNSCVQAAVGRAENCGTNAILCEVNARVFIKGCLPETQAFPEFCGGLPPYEERISRLNWALETCAQFGKSSDSCGRVVNEASLLCAKRKEASQ